jgi:hypothetical protein
MKSVQLLMTLVWMLCCAVATAEDPGKVLEEARSLREQGKYEEALQKHLWFHENALNQDSSWYGVRLSFALSDWIQLGEKYPAARKALVSIRDKNVKAITEGKGAFDLFHDLTAINEYLKEEPKTVELFKTIHQKYPELAEQCYHVAEGNLVRQREYKICIVYIPEPLKRFEGIREMRERTLKRVKKDNPELKAFAEEAFVDETGRLVEILVGVGRKQDAGKVRERALAVRDDRQVRDALDRALQSRKK